MALTRIDRLKYPSWTMGLTNQELLRELNANVRGDQSERRFEVLRDECLRRKYAGTLTAEEFMASDAYKWLQDLEKSKQEA
jgi:hypothetical protein